MSNYGVFIRVTCGYWNNKSVRDYELVRRFKENDENNAIIYHQSNDTQSKVLLKA